MQRVSVHYKGQRYALCCYEGTPYGCPKGGALHSELLKGEFLNHCVAVAIHTDDRRLADWLVTHVPCGETFGMSCFFI